MVLVGEVHLAKHVKERTEEGHHDEWLRTGASFRREKGVGQEAARKKAEVEGVWRVQMDGRGGWGRGRREAVIGVSPGT